MRQVTGSNPSASPERVSIQQSLDGHSFSRPELDRLTGGEQVQVVELLLPRTMLVPEELFCEESAREMLAANGMPAAAEEGIVVCRQTSGKRQNDRMTDGSGLDERPDDRAMSHAADPARLEKQQGEKPLGPDPEEKLVAIVAVEEKLLREIRSKCPEARFTTPLLDGPSNRKKCVWIRRREQLLYIKVYDKGVLRLAEVIPAASEAETGYLVEELHQILPLKEFELRISGDNIKELRKWIGKEFGKVICE